MKRVIVPLGAVLLIAGCSAARKPATLDVPKPVAVPAPAAPVPAPRVPINTLAPIQTRPIIAPPASAPDPAPTYVEPTPAPVEYTPAPAAPAPIPEPVYYVPPVHDENCAKPTDRGETDGGYGGTGLAPEDCPPETQL